MIPLFDIQRENDSLHGMFEKAFSRVLASGRYILDKEVKQLEAEVAQFLHVDYALGVASGTDALILALRALDIGRGDEVLVPAFSFWATASAVLLVGAVPVFCDIDPYNMTLDPDELDRWFVKGTTKAIIPVHLYGQPADMHAIMEFALKHGLYVIEDNAQAFGSIYNGKYTGTLGTIACQSFYPTKSLGALGDAGMVFTNQPFLAARVKMLRSHGWIEKYNPQMLGYNSRLDELQAAILSAKLSRVGVWNTARRTIALRYREAFKDMPMIKCQLETAETMSCLHLFCIRIADRDNLRDVLRREFSIETGVYYPKPLNRLVPGWKPSEFSCNFLNAEQAAAEVLAIPCFAGMLDVQVRHVITSIKSYYNRQ